MKLAYPELETVFDTEAPFVNTLVIESPELLVRLLSDIVQQENGDRGYAMLSDHDQTLDFSHYTELLDVFIPFDLNRKSLLSRISTALERTAMEPDHYEHTMHLLSETEKYLYDIAFDFPCDIVFSKISLPAIIKASGVEIRDDHPKLSEKVINYMELVREFERDKLFITLNLRSFLTDEEADLFLQTILDHGFHLIMIETRDHSRLPHERRVIIDSDMCEIT